MMDAMFLRTNIKNSYQTAWILGAMNIFSLGARVLLGGKAIYPVLY